MQVKVNNKMQSNYTYVRTEPAGRNFDPTFKPHFTPKEMLKMGVFEGKYLRDAHAEYPDFTDTREASGDADIKCNYFGVKSRQNLQVWKDKGWIVGNDPRGWFEWYCRYYYGRRDPVDSIQIARWRAFKRHYAQVKKNCIHGSPCSDVMHCRPRQRQALLQWSYDCFV